MPKANRYGKFEDARQAQQHLYNRYVIHNKRFGLVSQVLDKIPMPDEPAKCILRIYFEPYNAMSQREYEEVNIADEGFNDFRFDPLGWINHDTGAVLMELLPIRQTKHGYGAENIEFFTFAKNGSGWLDHPDLALVDLLHSEGAREMLRGEYPLFAETVPIVLGEPGFQAALSRLYAVQTDMDGYTWLWRGSSRIALVIDDQHLRLGKRYQYLREEISECGVFGEGVIVL